MIDICIIYSDNIDCTNPVTRILHKDCFILNTLYHAFLIISVVGFNFFHQKSTWADADTGIMLSSADSLSVSGGPPPNWSFIGAHKIREPHKRTHPFFGWLTQIQKIFSKKVSLEVIRGIHTTTIGVVQFLYGTKKWHVGSSACSCCRYTSWTEITVVKRILPSRYSVSKNTLLQHSVTKLI